MNLAPQTILVLHPVGLAETVLAIPALRSLRAHFPGTKISVATSPVAADILRLGGGIDEILPIGRLRRESISPRTFYHSWSAIRALRERRDDIVLEFPNSTESRFLLQMVQAATRLTAESSPKRGFPAALERISRLFSPDRPTLTHTAHRYLQQLESLGVRPIEAEPYLRTEREADLRVDKILAKKRWEYGELLVGIHPGAGPRRPHWPIDRFTSIARRFIHNFNARVIVFGGPSESRIARRIVKQLPHDSAFAIQSPLATDFASLLARMSLLVGNLSGPAHLATAVGTPVVAITGAPEPTPRDLLGRRNIHVRGQSVGLTREDEVYEAACRLLKLNRAEAFSWR